MIYTIGTSNRSISEFIDILKYYEIKILIDIRRFPTSRFEHFKRENLRDFLKKNKIDYIYLGNKLGGYRKGGYENFMRTKDFKDGLNKLIDLAKDKITCILCSERFPWKCHRRFVTSELRSLDLRVINIIDKERTWPKD